jgi:parallel beta-helix repeat protein
MTLSLGRALPAVLLILLVGAPPTSADVIRVASGESIAQALERATPGSVVEVEPGVYHEALTVDTPGITLRGIVRDGARPVLDGQGELGDGVIASGSPFSMSGFEIRHYVGNGVTTQGVDGVVLTDLVIDDTGLYGVYPVQSRNIEVTHTTVTRIRDAGIYVGESNRAVVAYNEVHRNVAGIEIENTNDALVHDNLVYDNTAGIAVFVLPGKVQKEGARTRVFRNWVVRNNRANFGDPESIIGKLPSGIGIYVMGVDDTAIEDNWIKQNATVGIGVLRLGKEDADKDPELEPNSDRTRIGFNHLLANGLDPHADIAAGYGRGADLIWDGTGTGNCADLPDAVTRAGRPLARCEAPSDPAPTPPAPAPERAGALAALPSSQDFDGPVVRIRGMRFEPHEIEIAVGQTVTWINEDAVTHTVTSGQGTQPSSAPLGSAFLPRGATYQFTFKRAGEYEYLCLPHLDQAPMRGARVHVVGAGS